jgi:deoxyribose-phosphate aldolase
MNLARTIEHTLLRADAKQEDIRQLCQEAELYDFYAVCVAPYWIATAKKFLADRDVKVCTVIGFPLGHAMSKTKITEAALAIEAGADEINVMMNLGAAIENHWNFVEYEIHDIVSAAKGKIVKIVLETCLLSAEQITKASQTSQKAGAKIVQTSTGFSASGATEEVVQLIRSVVGPQMGIAASGGIKDRATADALINAGATRLATPLGVSIVR